MTIEKRVVAVIPARGGSKGVLRKNIRDCGGKPLLGWTLEAAARAISIDQILLSTDDPEIAELGESYNVDVVKRPAVLASDTAPTEPSITHALDQTFGDWSSVGEIVLLQPTSPLRTHEHIDRAVDLFTSATADSLVSVCENHHFFWRNLDELTPLYDYRNRPRRQDIKREDVWYRENGAIYISGAKGFRTHQNRLFGKVMPFVMDEASSLEVDSLEDLIAADALLGRRDCPNRV